jgi:hypothetical protein
MPLIYVTLYQQETQHLFPRLHADADGRVRHGVFATLLFPVSATTTTAHFLESLWFERLQKYHDDECYEESSHTKNDRQYYLGDCGTSARA